jgi:UDP-N-acetylglucosamine 2-epimerase (non-hydrolysing)
MLIDVIAGARPNFMKVAALFAVADQFPALRLRLIQAGQHTDPNMSDRFLNELGLPEPAHRLHLDGTSGGHAAQTAAIMLEYESWVRVNRPDRVILVGDVNATAACALVAAKTHIPIAHVEAGLRSFDRTMPEEINRIVTDSLSDRLFATEPTAVANLRREGHPEAAIHWVGNVMIDTLLRMRSCAEASAAWGTFGLASGAYAYLTLHRPGNVDQADRLTALCDQIEWLGARIPLIFPIHPRTRKQLMAFDLMSRLTRHKGLILTEPLPYLTSLSLLTRARLIVTDSGGLQDESAALGVPCLTLRDNTERPITLESGINTLIGTNWGLFHARVTDILARDGHYEPATIPLWDGAAGSRILKVITSTE